MLTRDEFNALIKGITDTGEFTPDMEEAVKRLQDDFDEREGMLSKEGKESDEKETDEVESEGDKKINWEERYAELDKRYRERFFTTPAEIKESQDENVKSDGEVKSYEQLFKERE